jgi:hypothetical protein
MTSTSQCDACIHFDWDAPPGEYRCAAFPDVIPIPIQANKHNHSKPYPGDRGILFEQVRPGRRSDVAAQMILEHGSGRSSGTVLKAPAEPRKSTGRRRAAR